MLRLLVRCFCNRTLKNDGPHAHNITDVSLPDSFACPLSGCPLSFPPLASPQDHLVCAHFPWLSPPPRPKHGKAHSAAVRESGGDSGAGCGSDVRPWRTGDHKDAFHPRESRQQLSEGSAGGMHATHSACTGCMYAAQTVCAGCTYATQTFCTACVSVHRHTDCLHCLHTCTGLRVCLRAYLCTMPAYLCMGWLSV